jgi:cellulose synthase/poly-beta-1,6-N-acetylglucosamine synthase-like glycosyltransferase
MAVTIILVFNAFVFAYFLTLNSIYFLVFVVSLRDVLRFVRRTFLSDYDQMRGSPLTWPISILVPAFDEEKTIVQTVHSLLGVNYPEYEIIVINDGSNDRTLEHLREAFDLRPYDRVFKRSLPTERIRGVYGSLRYPQLLVVDKEKGGKPDALNAGINLSRYPLFCSIDADSLIEEDALLRVVKPFLERPDITVAGGGIVRIVNGCRVRDGRIVDIRLPRRPIAVLQVVEYLRAFLSGRVGWSALHSLLIISGAFGVYRKDVVLDVGGYTDETDTEDLELVVRMHQHLRREGRPYRMVFVPDPVCWTECPSTWRVLNRQRNRWHRGLIQTLWRHKKLMFNPRHGVIGTFALPYFLIFETFGPFIEIVGYVAVLVSWLLGILNTQFFFLFLVLALFYGMFLSVAAVLLEEIAFRRYPRWQDLVRLLIFGIAENLGYRQMMALVKMKAFVDLIPRHRRRRWGRMDREGFDESPPSDEDRSAAGRA